MSFWSDLGDVLVGGAARATDEWINEEFPEKVIPVDNTTSTTVTPDVLDQWEIEYEAAQQKNLLILGGSAVAVLVLVTILVTR